MAFLEVKNLRTHFFTRRGIVKAVDGVDFHVGRGETFGLVGESGCGKSVTCLSILRLVPQPAGQIVEGEILLEGSDLLKKSEGEMRRIRGSRVSMILQDPMTSLNPVFTVGDQVMEGLKIHLGLEGKGSLGKSQKNVGNGAHCLSGGSFEELAPSAKRRNEAESRGSHFSLLRTQAPHRR